MPKQNALKGHNFKSLVTITANDSGELPTQILVLPIGTWNTEFYGPMQVTASQATEIIANFKAGVRKAVPIDVDHDGGKAAGWIKSLELGEDGILANVEWTKYGQGLLEDKIYKLFSPEWSFDYVDPEFGSRHGAVLVAGSLTNRPLFKELPFLVASDGTAKQVKDLTNDNSVVILLSKENNMNVADILAKAKADRSAEEVAFLTTAELSDEQKTQIETEEKPVVETPVVETPVVETPAPVVETPVVETPAPVVEADDKTKVTITAEEHAEFLKAKETIAAQEKQLRQVATEKEVATLIASEKGGKILPKSKDAVVNFIMTCSEDQKKAFLDIVNQLPELKVAGEVGANDINLLTAKEQVVKLISEIRAKDATISEATAQDKVEKSNPELWKQYKEELNK